MIIIQWESIVWHCCIRLFYFVQPTIHCDGKRVSKNAITHANSGRCVQSDNAEWKEAFALFDKKGTGAVPRETLGDLLRALGQNPTQAEVADIVASAPRDGACFLLSKRPMRVPAEADVFSPLAVDYKTFLAILGRPDGFKPAGTIGN